jgi:8-oxo-dGTP pyrophosphatase MutT (NUDIX family)
MADTYADPMDAVPTHFDDREPLRVVAWVCVENNAVLSARSRGQSLFYAPGGKLEPGEDDHVALRREIREELGVELDPASIVPLTVIEAPAHGAAAGLTVRMSCYTADPLPSSPPPLASREIAEIAWLGLTDRERCAPADQALLDFLCFRGALT